MEILSPDASPEDAGTLLRLLAELHEKAYRRGYQHGHGAAAMDDAPTCEAVSQ